MSHRGDIRIQRRRVLSESFVINPPVFVDVFAEQGVECGVVERPAIGLVLIRFLKRNRRRAEQVFQCVAPLMRTRGNGQHYDGYGRQHGRSPRPNGCDGGVLLRVFAGLLLFRRLLLDLGPLSKRLA